MVASPQTRQQPQSLKARLGIVGPRDASQPEIDGDLP